MYEENHVPKLNRHVLTFLHLIGSALGLPTRTYHKNLMIWVFQFFSKSIELGSNFPRNIFRCIEIIYFRSKFYIIQTILIFYKLIIS